MVTRIRQLLEYKQLTPTQFADLIGVGRPVMSHILSERNKPSLEVVQRLISAFPDISLPWLLSGVGDMLAAATKPAPLASVPVVLATPAPEVAPEPSEESLAATLKASSLALEVALPAPVALPRPVGLSSPTLAAPVAAPAPVHIEPATFPQPVSSPVVAPAPAPAAAPAPLPVLPKPFRASRFVPSAPQASVPAPEVVAPLATPIAEPVPTVAPSAPALSLPPAPVTPTAPLVSTTPEAAMLPFLAESGKAIRRIVIFYRDGSFADYQPE